MKINAVVILYHPTEKEIQNINTYGKYVDKLYIFDNSENINNSNLLTVLQNKNYNFYFDNENHGLSITLNNAMKLAIKDNCDFLLTMDQDSSFLESELKKYINEICGFKNLNKVGQFGINFDQNINIYNTTEKFNYSPYLITSGSIINITNIKENNISFDNNLFIDSVDFDFSFQILEKGLKNVFFNTIFLNHKLGEVKKRSSFKSLYLIKKEKNIHPPLRLYYILRNLLYLEKKYKNSLEEVKKTIKNITKVNIKHIISSVFYANNPIKAIKNLIQAYIHYKIKRFGKK